MLLKLSSFVVASVITASYASPLTRNLVVRDERTTVPSGFALNAAAPTDQMLNLRVALVNSDIAGLESELYAVSTPSSARYGQHLTKEQVEEFVKPTSDTVSKVNAFFSENDISTQSASPAGDWLSFSVPVSKANEMFGANFSVFTYEQTSRQLVRTLSYSIPANLQDHISVLHPATSFVASNPRLPITFRPVAAPSNNTKLRTRQTAPSSCATEVTPSCLQALYQIPTTPATQSSNVLGVSGFIDQFANNVDLQQFLSMFRPDLTGTTFGLQEIDDGQNDQTPSNAGVEANLDTQYTVGVASKVPVTFISVGDDNSDGLDGFIDEANFLLGQDSPPTVLTTSYGFNEDEITLDLANTLCNAYMQLGARGVSVLYASGDGGVSGSQSEQCTTFIPTFPSGCPFLTSVGATTGTGPETAADFSSGGFSNLFSQPSYQSTAVSNYLSFLGSTDSGLFNISGRAFPDVSAQGVDVEIVVNGTPGTVDGTSCSSPIFASVIALLNDRLIAAGKPTLGFLNPFLYSTGASALNDVTTGDNPGCGTNGFPATTGWDPVTGLGTPNFPALLSAAGV